MFGLAIAAPVGPIGVLCIRRTLADGQLTGFVAGLGAATADLCYGSVAVLGMTALNDVLLGVSFWTRFVGGLLLTITNPATIIAFAAIFAGLDVANAAHSSAEGLLLVVGVFSGSALWWFILSSATGLLRTRVTPQALRWVNLGAGVIIGGFGVVALGSLLFR